VYHTAPIFGGTNSHGKPPLTNYTGKTSGKNLVKIRPAVAQQLRQKKKKQNRKYKTHVS